MAPHTSDRFRLKVSLSESVPEIWRLIDVDGDLTLAEFHYVLQTAFGWHNEHLHAFNDTAPYARARKRGRTWSAPSPWGDTNDDLPEADWTLDRVFAEISGPLFYLYDFGDSWLLSIDIVESVAKAPSDLRVVFIDGARRGPLEDSGGIRGYTELVESIADPGHERHEELREWLYEVWGTVDSFDPATFDVPGANAVLRTLPF